MIKIFTLSTIVMLVFVCLRSSGQLVSGTMVVTGASQMTVYGKPTADLTNVAMNNISFAFSFVDQGAGNNPVPGISNNYLPIITNWQVLTTFTQSGRVYYVFGGTGSASTPTTTWLANTNNPMLDISFSNTNGLSTLELDDLTSDGVGNGGGPGGEAFWFIQIISGAMVNPVSQQPGDLTNYPQMFYGVGVVNNGPTTLSGASSPSYVQIQLPSILPVTFLDFDATKSGSTGAALTWQTAVEENMDHFVVEKSAGGAGDWSDAGFVAAKGNSSTPTSYHFTDPQAYDGRQADESIFYRIRSVDLDGKSDYSEIRSVQFGGSTEQAVSVFPNPVISGFHVNISQGSANNDPTIRLNLLDTRGQLVQSREISAGAPVVNYYFEVGQGGAVAPGSYLLQVVAGGKVLAIKKMLIMRTSF